MTIELMFFYAFLILLVLTTASVLSFFILKYWKEQQNQANSLRWQEIQMEKSKATVSLRLQAYERLTLFCERITIPNLIKRLRTEGASAEDLRMSMLIAIQQEFEHNITQQVYVGEKLWNIVKIARDNTAEIINIAAEGLETNADSKALIDAVFKILTEQQGDSLAKAQAAIRQEAAILMGQ